MLTKLLKFFGWVVAVICLILIIFSAWYVIKFYPRSAIESETGDPGSSYRILIATQSSDFKNDIVDRLMVLYSDYEVFVKVTDISNLPEINPENWQGIALINTTIANQMNTDVEDFLERIGSSERTIALMTSGGGDYELPQLLIDGISTASRMNETEKFALQIYRKLGYPQDQVPSMENQE